MKKNNAKLIKVKESKLTEKAEIFILNANKTYAEFTPKQREAEAAHETHEKINKQKNEINKKPDFIEDELKIFVKPSYKDIDKITKKSDSNEILITEMIDETFA